MSRPALTSSMFNQLTAAKGLPVYVVQVPQASSLAMSAADRFVPFDDRSAAERCRAACSGELFEYSAAEVAAACA
jgi:hypothetical protein